MGYLGREIRILRERSGMTQETLGRLTHQSPKTISDYETGRKLPSGAFITLADSVLRADESLVRLWRELTEDTNASWFQWFLELEAKATTIRHYQSMLVPGLLQTEAYARHFMESVDSHYLPEEIDTGVATRLARQQVFFKEDPPDVTFVLDEAALRRWPLDRGVVKEQVEKIIEIGRLPRVAVHVIPFAHGFHPMMEGCTIVLSFDDADDHVYIEPSAGGLIITDAPTISRMRRSFERALGQAVTTKQSEELLVSIVKEAH